MKHTAMFLPLIALGLLLTACPASNGHAPFDVLSGRQTVQDVLIDNGQLDLIFPTKLEYWGSSITRSGGFSPTLYLYNGASSSYTFKSTDYAEFYYCLSNDLSSLYSSNATSGLLAKVSLSAKGTISSSADSYNSLGNSYYLSLSIPTAMLSGKGYCIGVKTIINGKTSRIAVTDESRLVFVYLN